MEENCLRAMSNDHCPKIGLNQHEQSIRKYSQQAVDLCACVRYFARISSGSDLTIRRFGE